MAIAFSGAPARTVSQAVERIGESGREALKAWGAVFADLMEFLMASHPEQAESRFGMQVRLVGSLRSLPGWTAVEVAWEAAQPLVREVAAGAAEIGELLMGVGNGGERVRGFLAGKRVV